MTARVRRVRDSSAKAPPPRSEAQRRAAAFMRDVDEVADGLQNRMFGDMYRKAVRDAMNGDNSLLTFIQQLDRVPVDIDTFLDGTEFFGATDLTMWPEVRATIVDLCSGWWKGPDGAYDEAILMGATSTGKSTICMVATAYHLYLLSCCKNPQALYGLPKATSIVFAVMGAKPHVVKKVVYAPMRKHIETMPYFQKHMPPDRLIESEMYFPEKNIRVVPVGGDEDGILGEAVIGGIIDEINFMQVVLRSKKAEVTSGRAGVYDQAEQVFSTMRRRKNGRFITRGPYLGIIFASSSTRYRGDFTDKRKAEVKKHDLKHVLIYDKRQFDVWPKHRYTGKTFRLLIGNDVQHDTRVLRDDEEVVPGAHVEVIPIEYLDDFRTKPYDALRDIMGISSNVISPFFRTKYKVYEAGTAGIEANLQSFLVRDHVILGEHGMPQVKSGHYCVNPSRPRYVHIDLSRNGDRCGIAMVRFDGMQEVGRDSGVTELLPIASVEMACTITPDANNEIDIAEVRSFVRSLKRVYKYPIKSVTYDGFDSRESIQQWRKDGMRSRMVSVDRSSAPYKQFRDAIYDGRVLLPGDNEVLIEELVNLEYDESKDKVDHPVTGTKDCADAACAAYSVMLERRSSWVDAANDDAEYAESLRPDLGDRFDEERPL